MEWNITKSDELKKRIATDEALMRKLSETTDSVFKKHGLELKGMSYLFEPRVFTLGPGEVAEFKVKSRKARTFAIIDDLYQREPFALANIHENIYETVENFWYGGEDGGMDPVTLNALEQLRIVDQIADDQLQVVNSAQFIKKIVGNKDLLNEFSGAIFAILAEKGITFGATEGCVFTPIVFETPIHAQKIAVAEREGQIRGFGPQIYDGAMPQPGPDYPRPQPYPGLIDSPWATGIDLIPGIILDKWWWIGIPAPELLRALDRMREMG
jgi:hypothetical protein